MPLHYNRSKKPNKVVQYKIANEKFLKQKAQEVSRNIVVYGMPSTSPANAGWTLRKLVDRWGRILALY